MTFLKGTVNAAKLSRIYGVILLSLFAVSAVAQVVANVTVTSSAAAATLGSAVTFTATLVPVQATGKMTFYAGTTVLGTRAISGGQALLTTSMLPAGTFPVRAYYLGDAGDKTSMSAPITQACPCASLGQPEIRRVVSDSLKCKLHHIRGFQ